MSTDEAFDEHDPFVAHFRREPLPGAGVRIILVSELPEESARPAIEPIVEALAGAGRHVETRFIAFERGKMRLGESIEGALEGSLPPLVLLTTAVEPWTSAHL